MVSPCEHCVVPRVSGAASTQAPSARSAFTGNEESIVSPGGGNRTGTESRKLRHCDHPGSSGSQSPSRIFAPEQGQREKGARESLPRPGKENHFLFLEKKNPCGFPPEIPFPSKARECGFMS